MRKRNSSGFTLIEVVMAIVILAMLVTTILGIFIYALRLVSDNRHHTNAITLAEQKMEIIRNLPYNDVGTIGGIPSGNIPQKENIVYNNALYEVKTHIVYKDDPADGILGVDPEELSGTDYKKVRIEVVWNGPFGQKSVVAISNIAPRRNQDEEGTGTLSVLVFDASGIPVPQADVSIDASIGTTTIDIDAQTNNEGRLIFPGAPAATNAYQIVVTKNGYSTDRTCAIDNNGSSCTDSEGNPNPTRPNASVIEGELTEVSFAIDLLSTLMIKTLSQSQPAEWIINTDTTSFDQDHPSLTICNNGFFIFSWRDFRQSGNPRIYAQMYDQNLIAQWSPDLAITTSNNQNNPDIAHDNNCNTYVVWNDDRNGNQDIYFEKYDSTPASVWSGAKKINTQADSADQTFPQILINASSTHAYIVWQDARNDTSDIYAQKFDMNGNSLWANEIKINTDTGSATQESPKIMQDKNESMYFVWNDDRSGNHDIYAQKYDSNGIKLWNTDKKINTDTTTSDQINPSFIVSSSSPQYLYIVWQDKRNGDDDIYAQKYDLQGSKIWTDDIRINSDSGNAIQEYPVIVEDHSGNLYIVWQDNRNGTTDIYMQKIDSQGNKLINFDVRIHPTSAGIQEQPDAFINIDGNLTVTWQDDSSGNFDIKAAVYQSDPQNIINMPHIPLTITGSKTIGNNPIIYKFSQSFTTDSNGDLTMNNIEWDSYTITVGGGYTLKQSEPAQPILVNPQETVTIYLNVE